MASFIIIIAFIFWDEIISKYYLTKQLEAKGWTGTAFTKFLGNHQKKMTPAPTKIFGEECMKKYFGSFFNHSYSLWDKEVVDKIEETPEFQMWLEKSLARRAKIAKSKTATSSPEGQGFAADNVK